MKTKEKILETKPLKKENKIKGWWEQSILKMGIKSVKAIFRFLK